MLLGLSPSCSDGSSSNICADAGTVGGPAPVPPTTNPAYPVDGPRCNDNSSKLLAKPDECACNGLTCALGKTCAKVFERSPLAIGGPGYFINGCFELCTDDVDCGPDRFCAANVYGFRECVGETCRSDADCDDEPCGVCIRGFRGYHGNIKILDETGNRCEYSGLIDAGPVAP